MGMLWRRHRFYVFVPLGIHILCTFVLSGVCPEHRCHVSKTRCWRANAPALLCDHPASYIPWFDRLPLSVAQFGELFVAFRARRVLARKKSSVVHISSFADACFEDRSVAVAGVKSDGVPVLADGCFDDHSVVRLYQIGQAGEHPNRVWRDYS
jgi:hypothetical protein